MLLSEHISAMKKCFLAQKLPGTYKSETRTFFLILFPIVGLLNFSLGIIAVFVYNSLFEVAIPYNSDVKARVYLPEGRVYLFLEIREFYQTNLRYSKSISYDQLKGQKPKNLSPVTLSYSDGKPIYPAGLLPGSFPQDKFKLSGLEIQTSDISWKSEREYVKPSTYTRSEISSPQAWENYVEVPNLSLDERFVNWIYISPFPDFRKFWGIIDVGTAGFYDLEIVSKFPHGKKHVLFVQSSILGPRNYFLSIGMILVGAAMILLSLVTLNISKGLLFNY